MERRHSVRPSRELHIASALRRLGALLPDPSLRVVRQNILAVVKFSVLLVL